MTGAKRERRPNTKTLVKVFQWLRAHDMSVYGPSVDLDTGETLSGCRDHDVNDAIRLAQLSDTNRLWAGEEQDD